MIHHLKLFIIVLFTAVIALDNTVAIASVASDEEGARPDAPLIRTRPFLEVTGDVSPLLLPNVPSIGTFLNSPEGVLPVTPGYPGIGSLVSFPSTGAHFGFWQPGSTTLSNGSGIHLCSVPSTVYLSPCSQASGFIE